MKQDIVDEIFKFTECNFKKLLNFGFKGAKLGFEYQIEILDGQFTLFVIVDNSGKVSTKLVDKLSEEEYVLHLAGGVGEFVGKVKTEYERVLTNIKDCCFERRIHSSNQAIEVIKFVKNRYNDELEYLWKKFPTDAIWRRKDNKKWYGLIMTIQKNKLGIDGEDEVEIMDVRADPKTIDKIVDNKKFFRGYHMNKKSWLTFILDGSVKIEEIFELINDSYELAKL